MNPAGKTALITGGGVRVGKAITLALARAGANVIINYNRSAPAAEQTADDARTVGVDALPLQADITDWEQVRRMVAAATERFGAIDILVNNASRWEPTPFPTDDVAAWQRVSRVLVDGAFYCANAVAPGMLEQGAGAIVNIIDLSAWEPWPDFAAHSVGKSALLGLTRQLALELAPAVRVNAVAPGPVLPPAEYDEERIARSADRTLLGRWGNPQDIAQAVLYFINADYVTGEALAVDGGERFGHRKPEHG
ncbi:MAG TPA: SDR family oxidoreductase [Candidatus Sulfomarinibacteraceae bacterium]|nr:SDR family oxidoreductase [Candidatus Sulfomarinibacteraceae bacterium]